MSKKLSESELVKRDQKMMDALVSWSEIIPKISRNEMKELMKFGARFGREAMVKRARSIIEKRQTVDPSSLRLLKQKTDLLVSARSIRRSSARKVVNNNTKEKIGKRKKFVSGFSKVAEPLVRSMLTLAFTTQVVYKYLNKDEVARLIQVEGEASNQQALKQLIELRSGSTIPKLMREIQDIVERDFTQMWVANIKDGITFGQNPDFAKKYETALENGNLAELTALLMKGQQ